MIRKNQWNLYWSFFLLFVLASCKPTETPEVFVGEPVFLLQLEIEGEQNTIIAGKEAYYMFTSYQFLSDTALIMDGTLSHVSKPSESPGIRFLFNKELEKANDPSQMDLLPAGRYAIRQEEDISLFREIEFDNHSKGEGNIEFLWEFGDGTYSSDSNPVKSFSLDNGPVEVTLTATDSTGSVSSITNAIDFTRIDCVNFFHENEDGTMVEVLLTGETDREGLFNWNTAGGQSPVSVEDSFLVEEMSLPEGTERVCLSSSPEPGCEHGYCRNIPRDGESCTANFIYTLASSGAGNSVGDLPDISIEYWDETGVFESRFWSQGTENYFLVKDSEDYDVNENGQKTKKLNIEFNLRAINLETAEIREIEGEGFIAVAVP